jgi:hypothetical protein
MTLRRRALLLVAISCLTAVGITACGGTSKPPPPKHFKTPKFLLHAGLGFGAFHTFIWAPAHAGKFATSPSAVSDAADAATFAANQLKQAAGYARRNPAERSLFAALTVVADKVGALRAAIVGPSSSLAAIEAVNQSLNRINQAASAGGHHINDASPAQIAAAGGPRT